MKSKIATLRFHQRGISLITRHKNITSIEEPTVDKSGMSNADTLIYNAPRLRATKPMSVSGNPEKLAAKIKAAKIIPKYRINPSHMNPTALIANPTTKKLPLNALLNILRASKDPSALSFIGSSWFRRVHVKSVTACWVRITLYSTVVISGLLCGFFNCLEFLNNRVP